MEEIKEVKIVMIDYKCPIATCVEGYLRPTGISYSTNPPMFPHKCTHCGYTESFIDKTYPYTEYR